MARLRELGIRGVSKGSGKRKQPKLPPECEAAPDLVHRIFTADAPNRVWSADITYVRTREGWLQLALVMDLFSRRIVGWSMAERLQPTSSWTRSALRSRDASRHQASCTIRIAAASIEV